QTGKELGTTCDPTLILPLSGEGRCQRLALLFPLKGGEIVCGSVCWQAQSLDRLADRFGDRPARQHTDEMGAVFGAAVDVAVHAIGRNAHAFERFRREAFLKRLLERRHAEHAIGAGAGHRDPDVAAALRHEYADQRETRRLVAEFLIGRFLRDWETYLSDDFRR